jgi:radical SAM protein with 4Fe4S-binding SPASM domain
MKAKIISGQAPGGTRMRLGDVLPLDTPFVLQIFPIYACNFKCGYCIFSVEKSKRHFISDKMVMDFDLFTKCIDDMINFPQKIKVLRFVGIGEPLLHKRIVDMVAYTVSKNVAHTVEMLTNASLLSPAMSDALISAGLTRMVVSLQGITKEKYRDVCGTHIDFDELLTNLKYFYDHKKNTQMYIKIVDCALDVKQEKDTFYELFGDMCDAMAIEHAVPIHTGVIFDKILRQNSNELTQFGLPVTDVHICPQPFFTMQINPDGKVVPCFSFEYPGIMGDCNQQSVTEIWNGREFNAFRRKMLDGAGHASNICPGCNIIKYRLFPEDVLNDDAQRLRAFYTEPA